MVLTHVVSAKGRPLMTSELATLPSPGQFINVPMQGNYRVGRKPVVHRLVSMGCDHVWAAVVVVNGADKCGRMRKAPKRRPSK